MARRISTKEATQQLVNRINETMKAAGQDFTKPKDRAELLEYVEKALPEFPKAFTRNSVANGSKRVGTMQNRGHRARVALQRLARRVAHNQPTAMSVHNREAVAAGLTLYAYAKTFGSGPLPSDKKEFDAADATWEPAGYVASTFAFADVPDNARIEIGPIVVTASVEDSLAMILRELQAIRKLIDASIS